MRSRIAHANFDRTHPDFPRSGFGLPTSAGSASIRRMAADPHDRHDEDADRKQAPFAPPEIPIEVHCIHCGETYDSWQMEVRNEGPGDEPAWCCATPGCDGLGFLFDIWPVDPEWRDEHGNLVVCIDEGEDDDFEFEGTVDSTILDAYWSDDYKLILPRRDAPDDLAIDFNGDDEHPLVRLFGESARPQTIEDIPF